MIVARAGHHQHEDAAGVYFQDVPEGVDRVDLRLDLVDANTGEQFGQVSIPFIPKDA